MKLIRTTLGIALAGLSLTGCFFDDNAEKHPGGSAVIITDPPAIALFGAGNHAFNNADVELEYNVLKIGLDTSGGTLRLPVSGVVVGDTFPYIWIANSGEGTISKLDVRTGQELGRYRTAPDSVYGNPSRTTVDQDGNVWVGNRANNTLTKVGLKEFGQCVDRNGNGTIETSTPVQANAETETPFNPDVKPWTGAYGDGLGVTNAADECILLHVTLTAEGLASPNDIRTVAIDPDNNVFVGSAFSSNAIFKINGTTGAIIKAIDTQQGHYGGVVDKEGNLWSIQSGSGKVQKTNKDMTETTLINIGHSGYGIAIDKYGKIWTTEYGARFSAFDPADPAGTLKVFNQNGVFSAQGIATDDNGDVFIAGALSGSSVGHYKQVITDGVLTDVTFVRNYPTGSGPTGVAVDGFGHVWSANNGSSNVTRIQLAADPANAVIDNFAVGISPYNYSDMTGRVVRTITNRQGTWEATFNGGKDDFLWQRVLWKLKQALPEGTEVTAFAKTANTEVELGAKDYVQIQNDADLVGISGRFLKLKVRLTSATADKTPEITELILR